MRKNEKKKNENFNISNFSEINASNYSLLN